MSEKKQYNIADGLREIKLLEKRMGVAAFEIRKYCSKKKGAEDEIKKQAEHVKSLRQKYKDLLKNWTGFKLAIQKANLKTFIEYVSDTDSKRNIKMSLAEAIMWKGVKGAHAGRKEMERTLWSSFTTQKAEEQIRNIRVILEREGMSPGELAAANIVPELLGWEQLEVQAEKEFIMELEGRIDALIDAANVNTYLKL